MIRTYYPLITVKQFIKENNCLEKQIRKAIDSGLIETSVVDSKECLEINSTKQYISNLFEEILENNLYKKKYEETLNNALNLCIEHKILRIADNLQNSNSDDVNVKRVLGVAEKIKERRSSDKFLKNTYINVSDPNSAGYFKLKEEYQALWVKIAKIIKFLQKDGLYNFDWLIFNYKPNPPFLNNSVDILTNEDKDDIKKQIKRLMVCEMAHTINL